MHHAGLVLLVFVAIGIAIAVVKRNKIEAAAKAEAKAIEQSLANYAKSEEKKAAGSLASSLRGAADKVEKF